MTRQTTHRLPPAPDPIREDVTTPRNRRRDARRLRALQAGALPHDRRDPRQLWLDLPEPPPRDRSA